MQAEISPGQRIRHRYVAQRLNGLMEVMLDSKSSFEKIASQTINKNFRQAVAALVMECSQYVTELANHVSSLGIKPCIENYAIKDATPVTNCSNEDDILILCYGKERMILKAYREILNDPSILHPIRQLIIYQLNGMKYAFVKVKLLDTTTHL